MLFRNREYPDNVAAMIAEGMTKEAPENSSPIMKGKTTRRAGRIREIPTERNRA